MQVSAGSNKGQAGRARAGEFLLDLTTSDSVQGEIAPKDH